MNELVWKMTEVFLGFVVEQAGREQVRNLLLEVKVNVPAMVVMGLMSANWADFWVETAQRRFVYSSHQYCLSHVSYQPLHLGTLYYLNVHAEPPYRWQRVKPYSIGTHSCYRGWLAPSAPSLPGSSTGRAPLGRAVVQLDLVNCFAVESALSLSHPCARDDVGEIAAREQDALSQSELGLVESLVPFWMVYGDGVERLACDSLVQRLRWIERIW